VTGGVARGPERLTGLFAAVAALLLDSPARQLEALHLWSAICQGLVALPLWLAARQLGLGRWQALVPAMLGSAGSFAFYGVLLLPTSVALLAAMLLLCALLRALARPGAVADLLVIVALGLLVLARIGWAPLVAALAPATLAACWFGRPAGEPLLAWLRRLPARLLRRHPLLVPLAALGLVVVVVAGPSELVGGEAYGGIRLKAHIVGSVVWDNTRVLGAHLAIGTALIPFVLALPALARDLARPREALHGAFAWLLIAMLLIFSWAYYASMNEDRYFAVLAPPLVLAGALAAFRRPPPLWSILVSGGLVTWLVASSYEPPAMGIVTYFVAPTSQFMSEIAIGKLTSVLTGADHTTLAALVVGAATVGALLAVLGVRGRLPRRASVGVAGLLVAGSLGWQLAALDHPARHFVDSVGMTTLTVDQLEFVDRAAAGGSARPLAFGTTVDPDLVAQLAFLQSYNASLGGPLSIGIAGDGTPAPGITIDWATGRTRALVSPPTLLLQLAGAAPVGFAGQVLAPEPAFPWAQLVRLEQPPRAAWLLRGVQADRYPAGGVPVEARTFPGAAADSCLSGLILAHPFVDGPVHYRLASARRTRSGVVTPGTPVTFSVPVPSGRVATTTLTGEGRQASDGIVRGPTLTGISIGRCSEG
jgi:hypothetical protein